MLAASVRLDSFKRVKAAIDKMITALLNQKAEETKVLEECKSLVRANDETLAKKNFDKKETADKIDQLNAAIKEFTDIIATNKQEIADLKEALAQAVKERAEENAEYKQVIMDQTATQELLKKALGVLHEFYDKNLTPEIPALVQSQYFPKKDAERSMPEDFDFEVYDKQTEEKKEGGVFQLINDIIYDSKQTVKDAEREERNAVAALKEFSDDTNNAITPKQLLITQSRKSRAEAMLTLGETKQKMEDTVLEILQLTNEKAHIDQECGFLFKNYETRQTAIDGEIESLKQAKAILSGADFRAIDTF